MAVAIDNAGAGTNNSGSTTLSFSHTASGSERYAAVPFSIQNGDTATGVTYGGVSMTQVIAGVSYGPTNPNTEYAYIYGLVAPATGSQTVTITRSSSTNGIFASATSLTGVNQTTPINATGSKVGDTATSNADNTVDVVSTVDGCGLLALFSNNANTNVAQTGSTSITDYGGNAVFRSTTFPQTTAGSFTFNAHVSGTHQWAALAIAIQPPSVSAIASINGVPLANIASMNGVAIANISSVNGVSNV